MSTTTATATAARFTAEKSGAAWTVVRITSEGRETVGTYGTRSAARDAARYLNDAAQQEAQDVNAQEPAPEDAATGGPVNTFTDPQAPEAEDEVAQAAAEVRATYDTDPQAHEAAQRHLDELVAKHSGTPAKAAKASRITLARVKVGDRLMTNLHTDGEGHLLVQPFRWGNGQVREVAEVTTRKAGDGEMPGTLYTLVFTDGTCSEERYGTTSHYPAEAFAGHPADANVERVVDEGTVPAKPAKKAPAPAKAKAPKVPTVPSRAGKLQEGSRLVLRDLGVVTVDRVSKTGDGKLEVAYTPASGEPGVREMWTTTNVRIAADS